LLKTIYFKEHLGVNYKYFYLSNIYNMEFGVSCSPAQMRKLKSGGAVTLNRTHFVEGSPHRIMVMPNTGRRIMTAMKKDKGVRIALKPEEDIVAMTEGGKISLKSIGRSFSKAFDPKGKTTKAFKDVGKEFVKTGDVIKRGFNKEIVDSGVGKEIAKNLIRAGTDVILPGALGAASMALGDPTGMSGQIVGNIAGNYIKGAAEKGGYGARGRMRRMEMEGGSTYAQRLARRTRNTFKPVAKVLKKIAANPVVKEVGKVALREGAKAAGEALTAYTGNPAAGIAFERLAVSGGDKLIETGSAKKAIGASKNVAKRMAVEAVDDYIDANLTGVERDIAQKALAGRYSSASDLVYDYGNSKIENFAAEQQLSGYGIPRRTRGGLRMGKGMAHLTPAYSVSMRSATSGAGFRVADDRMVTPAPSLSGVIQTGSPYQRINSAAMSPFIPSSPQLAGQMVGRSGGSFYPAGRGGSFVPSG
jgi:hypothetical protein